MAHRPQYAEHTALVREAKRILLFVFECQVSSSLVSLSVPFLLWLALMFAVERTAAGIGHAKSGQWAVVHVRSSNLPSLVGAGWSKAGACYPRLTMWI